MTAKYKIVDEAGRQVALLKRIRNGAAIDVSVWFVGDMYHPSRRGGYTNKPFKIEESASFDENTARSLIKLLERAGRTGFKMVER